MKIIWQCSYCNKQSENSDYIEQHEKECSINLNNSLCKKCIRYFNSEEINIYKEKKKVFICTMYGLIDIQRINICPWYVKDLDIGKRENEDRIK